MNTFRIPEMARPYIEYDMIQNHTDLPHFPEFRTRLLHAFLNKSTAIAGFSDLYTLVTSLVQLGLDTHDMVSVTNDDKERKAARSRQLKVLAGDYFSSRFYYLLSHAGQIDLIGVLSNAICEANRIKMNLYLLMNQFKMTADEYIRHSVEAKSQLFLSYADLLEERFRKLWPEVLRLFTRCEVLLAELVRSESARDYRNSWGYWHVMQTGTKEEAKLLRSDNPDPLKLRSLWHKYNVTAELYELLERCSKELQDKLQSLGSDTLAKELQVIGEPFRRYLAGARIDGGNLR